MLIRRTGASWHQPTALQQSTPLSMRLGPHRCFGPNTKPVREPRGARPSWYATRHQRLLLLWQRVSTAVVRFFDVAVVEKKPDSTNGVSTSHVYGWVLWTSAAGLAADAQSTLPPLFENQLSRQQSRWDHRNVGFCCTDEQAAISRGWLWRWGFAVAVEPRPVTREAYGGCGDDTAGWCDGRCNARQRRRSSTTELATDIKLGLWTSTPRALTGLEGH
jgi:hypothetical protein